MVVDSAGRLPTPTAVSVPMLWFIRGSGWQADLNAMRGMAGRQKGHFGRLLPAVQRNTR
jgi:hypothetical protein